MAIRSGLPNKIEDLLKPMSEIEVIDCLTSTYGLGKEETDDDGLVQGTTPILHAAMSGNLEVFLAVLSVMRARLGLQQVMYTVGVIASLDRYDVLTLSAYYLKPLCAFYV